MNYDSTMGDPQDEQQWTASAGRALRASEAGLDALTAARLRAARARAVAAAASGRNASWVLAAPAALAAAVLAWTLLPRAVVSPDAAPVNLAGADALELLADEKEPEFYQDLDLYLWLEEPDASADSA